MAGKDKWSGRHYWLIAKRRADGRVDDLEVFSLGLAEREYLPVFNFGEEAEMFLKLGDLEEEWKTRKIGSRELLLMLFGSLSCMERVALDPLPEISNDMMMTGLLCINRKRFMDNLLTLGRRWWWVRSKDGEGRVMD